MTIPLGELTEQLFFGGTAHHEIFGRGHVANQVHATQVDLLGARIHAGHDGLDEERPESTLVQHIGQHGGKRLGLNRPILLQFVHLDAEANLLEHGLRIRSQTRQTHPQMRVDLEHLGEIGGDGAQFHAVTQIRGHGQTIAAFHGDHGASIVRQNTLKTTNTQERGWNQSRNTEPHGSKNYSYHDDEDDWQRFSGRNEREEVVVDET